MFRYKCRSWFLLDPILTSRMALIHSDSLVWRLGFHSVCPVITCSIPLSIIWCRMMRNLPLSHSLKWVSAHGSDEGAGCHRCCTRVLCDGHLHPDRDMLYMLIVIEPGLVLYVWQGFEPGTFLLWSTILWLTHRAPPCLAVSEKYLKTKIIAALKVLFI